jgi:hypothetical protein
MVRGMARLWNGTFVEWMVWFVKTAETSRQAWLGFFIILHGCFRTDKKSTI